MGDERELQGELSGHPEEKGEGKKEEGKERGPAESCRGQAGQAIASDRRRPVRWVGGRPIILIINQKKTAEASEASGRNKRRKRSQVTSSSGQ